MKSYRQVIESVIGRSVDKENINPNLRAEEQLRKVNFRLQQEKDELMKEVKALRESNSKLLKKVEVQTKKRQSFEKESQQLKSKLNRTQTIKNSMVQRLYMSNKTLVTKRFLKSDRQEQPSQSNVSNAVSSIKSIKQVSVVTQSIQTQSKLQHQMSVQVSIADPQTKKQLAESKKQIKQLEKTILTQQKIIQELSTPFQTERSSNTDRWAGRIVKSRRHLL